MSFLQKRALEALAGATRDKPARLDDLARQLEMSEAGMGLILQDLCDARAINLITITKAGETYTVAWPTGIPPRPMSPREFSINGRTAAENMAASQAAHDALNPPTQAPKAEEEAPMPRITKPALPAKPALPTNKTNPKESPLMDACLAVLRSSNREMLTQDVLDALPIASTKGSVDAALRKLRKRGKCQGRQDFVLHRTRWVFWAGDAPIICPDEAAVAKAAAQAVAYTPEQTTRAKAEIKAVVATKHPRLTRRFSYGDDGSLEIAEGGYAMLSAAQVGDLIEFMSRVLP